MAIPAVNQNPTGRSPIADGSTKSPPPPIPASADETDYQSTLIGGVYFHFYPIIVHGNVATIYPHHGVLKYGHAYGRSRCGWLGAETGERRVRGRNQRLDLRHQASRRQPRTSLVWWFRRTARAISTPSRAPSTSFPTSRPSR